MTNERGTDSIVETTVGPVRGIEAGGLAIFHGIPYAAPPVAARRFRPPEPAMPWHEVRDTTRPAPIAPQLRSRLADVMGDCDMPQSEDCLTLKIWTPAIGKAPVPVLVWLHGGAFTVGSAELPWYSGQNLAERGDIVVVGVSYRLGALGFLHLPGIADGNMGLLDQEAALRWINANIARFGGDPERITLCGQSAGAWTTLVMMGHADTNRLFQRAILMSGPFGTKATPPDEATRSAHEFLEILGLGADDVAQLRSVPAERLLTAGLDLTRRHRQSGDPRLPFMLTADGKVVADDYVTPALGGVALGIDVLLGTTRDEFGAFSAFDPEIASADASRVRAIARGTLGAGADDYLAEVARLRPHASPYILLRHLLTDTGMLRANIAFAEARAKLGRPVHLYRFDWQSPTPKIGACHCIDLPFLFNNFADWPDAPMLAGGDPSAMAALALAYGDAFIAFVRTGDPGHDGIAPWPAYTAPGRATMRFDTIVEPAGDLAGAGWRRSWTELQG
ncbi:MAG: carboxylesterase/lipase family protein [Stellaceae bacterium]